MNQDIAIRIEQHCYRMLNRGNKELPVLIDEQNWKGLASVTNGICRDSLILGMLNARQGEEPKKVFDIFFEGVQSANNFLSVPSDSLPISNLDIPLYLCLITGNFRLAYLLATRIKEENLIFVSSSHFDHHTKMISGFILSDLELINEHENRLFKLRKLYWWERQRLYFDMYRAITNGDDGLLDRYLSLLKQHFASRAQDKKFGDQLPEYGGLAHNQFCLDFMALGIISYAIQNGIKISYDSRFVPIELVNHG
jgi:hypothetical protein